MRREDVDLRIEIITSKGLSVREIEVPVRVVAVVSLVVSDDGDPWTSRYSRTVRVQVCIAPFGISISHVVPVRAQRVVLSGHGALESRG